MRGGRPKLWGGEQQHGTRGDEGICWREGRAGMKGEEWRKANEGERRRQEGVAIRSLWLLWAQRNANNGWVGGWVGPCSTVTMRLAAWHMETAAAH